MSRHSTPASDFGRLALGGSSTSSSGRSGDMPVTTRAMRRGQTSGSGSQQSASRSAAGSSRTNTRSSRTQRGAQAGRRPSRNGHGDDGDDSSSDDDSGEEGDAAAALRAQNRLAAFEVAAALDQQLRSPRELLAASAQNNDQRRLADALASRFQSQADLDILRGVLTRRQALDRIQANFQRRYMLLLGKVAADVQSPGTGYDVVTAMPHFQTLATAIGEHIQTYIRSPDLADRGRGLAGILFEMVNYFVDRDRDLYAGANAARAQYAGGGNQGNIFRRFVAQHMGFMEVFVQLDQALLRGERDVFENIVNKVRANGASNGDRPQYERLLAVMHQIWRRKK